MGADAVLVNTAVAVAGNPVQMACAFQLAVEAARGAHLRQGLPGTEVDAAASKSPLDGFVIRALQEEI